MMPRAYIRETGQGENVNENALANFCFLARADNRIVGGAAPSAYRKKMPADIEKIKASSLFTDTLFEDNYEKFANERARALDSLAHTLMGLGY